MPCTASRVHLAQHHREPLLEAPVQVAELRVLVLSKSLKSRGRHRRPSHVDCQSFMFWTSPQGVTIARQKAEQQPFESAMKSRLGLYNYREILLSLVMATIIQSPVLSTPALPHDPEAAPAGTRGKHKKAVTAVRAVLTAARARRGGAGLAVLQADVDLAADELVAAGVRPYPQLLSRVTGGSLSTLTKMFEDWWQRFAAARRPEAERMALAAPLRTTLHLRHLLAALEDAARAELGLKDAEGPLVTALQAAEVTTLKSEVRAVKAQLQARGLGESSALTLQVKALEARREQLQQDLEGMTYQVTQLTGQLEARHEALRAQEDARREAIRRLAEGFARVEALLTRPVSADEALARISLGLERLRKHLRPSKPKSRPAKRAQPTMRRTPAGRVTAQRKKTSSRRPRRRG